MILRNFLVQIWSFFVFWSFERYRILEISNYTFVWALTWIWVCCDTDSNLVLNYVDMDWRSNLILASIMFKLRKTMFLGVLFLCRSLWVVKTKRTKERKRNKWFWKLAFFFLSSFFIDFSKSFILRNYLVQIWSFFVFWEFERYRFLEISNYTSLWTLIWIWFCCDRGSNLVLKCVDMDWRSNLILTMLLGVLFLCRSLCIVKAEKDKRKKGEKGVLEACLLFYRFLKIIDPKKFFVQIWSFFVFWGIEQFWILQILKERYNTDD